LNRHFPTLLFDLLRLLGIVLSKSDARLREAVTRLVKPKYIYDLGVLPAVAEGKGERVRPVDTLNINP
jgi:hypothetical protein